MNQVLRDKLRTLFFKYVEVASPEISLKSFKNVDIKGKTLLVGVGKASIPYCEKIQDKILDGTNSNENIKKNEQNSKHPLIYLKVPYDSKVYCPYCGREFFNGNI